MGRFACLWGALVGTVSATPPQAPPEIRVRSTPAGVYFTDSRGHTLYFFEDDREPGRSECQGECARTWRPLIAAADRLPPGDEQWTVFVRDDGSRQWAWKARPLYGHVRDTHAGAAVGEGVAGKWHVAFLPNPLPAGLTLQRTLAGRVLADHRGHTLYWRSESRGGTTSERSGYRPFIPPAIAKAAAPWSISVLPDGTRQWAHRGQTLFVWDEDHRPGDLKGHQPKAGWRAAALEPPPATPGWVTVSVIDTGPALADARGMTLYAARSMAQIQREKTCLEDCMRQYWRPVLAGNHETPTGNWSIRRNDAGQRQWYFNDSPVYTHTRDRKPGDSTGAGFGVGQGIGGGWRPIPQTALLPPT